MRYISTALSDSRQWFFTLVGAVLRGMLALGSVAIMTAANPCAAQERVDQPMIERLETRVSEHPHDASAWRMLARVHRRRGDNESAAEALARALELDPENAATHFDLGMLLLDLGRPSEAREFFLATIAVAPGSHHADAASEQLQRVAGLDEDDSPFRLVNFEPSWFDQPTVVQEARDPPDSSPWRIRFQMGTLYNSNVALAPISRQLSPDEQDGWQAFAKPRVEYRWLEWDDSHLGLLLDNYLTVNEGSASEFDLLHVQPGIFVESPQCWLGCDVTARLEYNFAYDAFGGETLGTRHEVTGSLSHCTDDGVTSTLYWTSGVTDFRDEGANPSQDSLDGWAHTLGGVRTRTFQWEKITVLQVGGDLQWADLRGDNQIYRGATAFLAADVYLNACLVLRPEVGLGFRTYPDFTGTPSRDELIIRTGGQLKRWLGEHWYLAGTFYYDDFASDNSAFAANRFTSGVLVGYDR